MANEISQFEKNNLTYFLELSRLTSQKKQLEKQEKEIKQQIQESMEKYDVQSIDNEHIKISYVEPKPSITIDLKQLEKKENELYEGLLKDYPKETIKKPYLKFTVR